MQRAWGVTEAGAGRPGGGESSRGRAVSCIWQTDAKKNDRENREEVRREGAGGFLEKRFRNAERGEVRKKPELLDWRHWSECMVL